MDGADVSGDEISILSSLSVENPYFPNLDEEIEELDDAEFDIPPVEIQPTLESILYDTDNGSFSDEEFNGHRSGLFHETADSASLASTSSLDSRGRSKHDRHLRSRRSPAKNVHGSILRQFVLRGVSSQILSAAAERVHAGMPTAMAVSSLIAVGTSHGVVLLFDVKQVLKWCLGSKLTGDQYGSVSSLGFNSSCTRLLCGYAKGQITMWDTTSGKLLRTIVDAHPPGTAVLHIQFTDDPTLAVCSDNGGSVFELNFKRVMGVRSCDSRCIFSGSRGEVCTIQVLNMGQIKDHPLQEVCIIAMATLSKIIVVSIRPNLKVLFTHTLKATPSTLPLLFWQFVVIQVSSEERVVDPVLSFGRENVIYFFQVATSSKVSIQFLPLQKMELDYTCLNFLWMNSRTMVILDRTEHLHVVDVRTREELEVLDLANVQLVYGSSHFKGLSTGGNVSKAMVLAGEFACYQSVINYTGQVLLLGTKSVHVLTLRTWSERIDQLQKQHRFPEALALALSFYEERAKAVVGLVNKKERKKAILGEKILELLYAFVDFMMATLPTNARVELVEEHYLDVIPLCIEYCIILSRRDLIFERFYESFTLDEIGRAVFLESLEQYIVNDSLVSISPTVLKEFVEHYESKGLFQELESCIIHLKVENLDLHQVVTLCWKHKLYDAIIYIYTKGMSDFTTPFQELMAILQKGITLGKPMTSDVISLGNRLLVYTSCCLAGRAYPFGNIPAEQRPMVKTEMFRCLTLLHTRNAPDDEPPYPYLRTFLQFDTRELLNVMSLAFEEPEFTRDAGLFQRQRLVDILLQIMVDGEGFTPSQVGSLFTFLARQLSKQDNTIVVNRSLFEQVLEYLTNVDRECRHAERQHALLELLNAGGLQHYDEERLLLLCDKAQFFQVCELLYGKRREFHKILSCYLRESSRKVDVFSFVDEHFKSPDVTTAEKNFLEAEASSKIVDMINIDGQRTVQMIANCFPKKFRDILDSVESNPEVQFRLLGGLFDCGDRNQNSDWIDAIYVDSSLQEKYIQLMCRYSSHDVASYLKTADNYRLEMVLEIVQEFCIRDAMAYLFEKMGDIHAAFTIMLEEFKKNLHELCQINCERSSAIVECDVTLVKNSLSVVIQFCQRNSNKMDESEREAMWFPLLEIILLQLHKQGESIPEDQQLFKELIDQLLNSMMGYIKLPSILQRIIKDPSYQSSRFGEMRELLLGMLETYNYEITLLSTTKNLVNVDLHQQLVQLKRTANCGYSSSDTNTCSSCSQPFTQLREKENTILFRCGHHYHEKCLKSATVLQMATETRESILCCILCHRSKHGSIDTERRVTDTFGPRILSPSSRNGTPIKGKLLLDSQQLKAIETLKKTLQSPSRLQILEELKETPSTPKEMNQFRRDSMKLHLSPPRGRPLPHDV